ncbi:MAG: hypothetical protein IJV17_00730 [Prevotella sp.]|nr:hypothetical protein [Prevotella sp.]
MLPIDGKDANYGGKGCHLKGVNKVPFRVEVTFRWVIRRSLLLLAAGAANIVGGRC